MHGGGSDLAAGLNHVMRAPRGSESLSEKIYFTPKGRGGERKRREEGREERKGCGRGAIQVVKRDGIKARRENENPSRLQVTSATRPQARRKRWGGGIPPLGLSRSASSGGLRPQKSAVLIFQVPTGQMRKPRLGLRRRRKGEGWTQIIRIHEKKKGILLLAF